MKQSKKQNTQKKNGANQRQQMAPQGKNGKVIRQNNSVGLAQASANKGQTPRISVGGDCTVVKHRELLINITGSDAFVVQAGLAINPGLALAFPWLQSIARNFEMYKFRKLKFQYIARCPTTQGGGVYMSLDPKSSDNVPASEQILGTYNIMVEDTPWKDSELVIPQDVLNTVKLKYVRTSTLSVTDLSSLFDVGKLLVATVGFGGNNPAGKIWVEYEVELHTPCALPQGVVESGTIDAAGAPISPANPFGSTPGFFGLLIQSVAANAVQLQSCAPGAEYGICLYIIGTTITACTITPTNGVTKSNQAVVNAGATVCILFYTFTAGTAAPSFVVSITAASLSDANLFIARLEPIPAF